MDEWEIYQVRIQNKYVNLSPSWNFQTEKDYTVVSITVVTIQCMQAIAMHDGLAVVPKEPYNSGTLPYVRHTTLDPLNGAEKTIHWSIGSHIHFIFQSSRNEGMLFEERNR